MNERGTLSVLSHAVGRIAGCSFDDLLALSARRSAALVVAAEQAAAELEEASARLCAALFAAVPRAADPPARRLLLAAQRAAFRKKPVHASLDVAAEELDAYRRALAAVASLDTEAEDVFAEELARIRNDFRELLRRDVMQDGLALSSMKLLDSINRFYLLREELNGKDLDTELGAMKYFSRAAAKTSPFSKFTPLAAVTVDDGAAPLEAGEASPMQSHVRLNVRLLFLLLNVLTHDRTLRVHLPLRLNSTLAAAEGGYRFLTNWSNVEAFQEVAAHPAVDFVVERLRDGTVRWCDLEAAAAGFFDCEPEDAAALVRKFVSLGLVEVDLGISASDPDWDLRLAHMLRAMDAPLLADALAELRDGAAAFGEAHGEERIAIRERMSATLKAATAIETEAPERVETEGESRPFEHARVRQGLSTRLLVYEDATLSLGMRVRREDVEVLARAASRVIDAVADFDPLLDEREALQSFVAGRYAGAPVPLLTLYEDFHRHQREVADAAPRRSRSERVARNEARLARLREGIRGRAGAGRETLQLTRADLDTAGLPDRPREGGPSSNATFLQCFVERGVLCGVANALAPGFGKLANRFLHLLPPEATREMRAWHERISGNAILAEAVDASYFNANLHPPLMPFEISTPGGQTSLPPSRQIAVSDLMVDAGLTLVHAPSGRVVHAFDCGLQRLSTRSKLYQLLALFSPGGQPNPLVLFAALNSEFLEPDGGGVRRWPRIVFEERLVLQRRRWDFPKALLPLRERGESPLAYFRRVDRWRRLHELPRHVFVRLGPAYDSKLRNKDDRKPQFVSFDSPLLVSVFEKLLPKTEAALEISEMLPAPEQLTRIDGKRHVTEHVFQWYR